MTVDYQEFLASKKKRVGDHGRNIDASDVHPMLHDWQKEAVMWSVRKGRDALWEDTGLGKTIQSLEWARLSGNTSLIVAPLGVAMQTVREAHKIDIDAHYVRSDERVTGSGIWITNYEMIDKFDPKKFDAVVLDESSILKSHDGKTRTKLIKHFARVPYRLSCTATPAPNDPEELTNQAEYLGVCSRTDMLATYFIHDDEGWRVKKHAREPMLEWMAGWAIALRKPSDLGDYSNEGYDLPGLDIIPHLLPVDLEVDGQLFATSLGGVSGRALVRRQTLLARCERTVELVKAKPDEPWLIWGDLNAETDLLTKLIPGAVNVHGSMSPEAKTEALLGFADGSIQVLVTKPSVAGHGMNYQHCSNMAFVGLKDSFEAFYQAVRRCYRYGQTKRVSAHIVLSELEGQIAQNVARKERMAESTRAGLVAAMRRARLKENAA